MLVQPALNFCPTVAEGNICLVKLTVVTNSGIIHYKDNDNDDDDDDEVDDSVNVCNFS